MTIYQFLQKLAALHAVGVYEAPISSTSDMYLNPEEPSDHIEGRFCCHTLSKRFQLSSVDFSPNTGGIFFRVSLEGYLQCDENKFPGGEFDCHIFKTVPIVSGGELKMRQLRILPLRDSEDLTFSVDDNGFWVFDLTEYPIVMPDDEYDEDSFITCHAQLLTLKTAAKLREPEKATKEGVLNVFEPEVREYLKSLKISDDGAFRSDYKGTDNSIKVQFKGLSNVPTKKDYLARKEAGTISGAYAFVQKAEEACENFNDVDLKTLTNAYTVVCCKYANYLHNRPGLAQKAIEKAKQVVL